MADWSDRKSFFGSNIIAFAVFFNPLFKLFYSLDKKIALVAIRCAPAPTTRHCG
jgi:hypothetical protein